MFKRKAKISSTLRKRTKSLDCIPEEINSSNSFEDPPEIMNNNSLPDPNPQPFHNNSLIALLKIPDVIKDLQTFDGNPKLLHEFINNVEEILLFCRGVENTPQGQIYLRAIRNKIVGEANETLNSYLTPLVWETIKNNLLISYADKRDETTLIKELHNVDQYQMSIEQFHGKIVEIQSALLHCVSTIEQNKNVIEAKRKLYLEMCLNSFVSGIKGPLGSTVRCMQPNDLSTAYAYVVKERNIMAKAKYDNNWRQNYNGNYQNNKSYRPQSRYNPTYQNLSNNPFNRPSFERQAIGNQHSPQTFNPNRNPNYNNNRNIPQIKASTSTMTRNSNNYRNSNYSNQFRNQNNLKLEELNNINNTEETELCNIEEDGNFRNLASRNQSLT